MDTVQTVTLALVQGLTEFLPISSSAHLILVPALVGWPDQGLAFDVAVHVGTLLAVLLYFRRELAAMAAAWGRSLAGAPADGDARLGWVVLLATLPVVVAGWLGQEIVANHLRAPLVIAATTIMFGLLLWWADRSGARRSDEYSVRWRDALAIGLAQVLALIPGTSRSGITMTAGLLLGLTRQAAARFSFLLAIPTIAGSGVLLTLELLAGPAAVEWGTLLAGAAVAGASAYLCIHFFLQLLERTGMLPFVIYRLVLGVVLLAVFH